MQTLMMFSVSSSHGALCAIVPEETVIQALRRLRADDALWNDISVRFHGIHHLDDNAARCRMTNRIKFFMKPVRNHSMGIKTNSEKSKGKIHALS